MNHNFTPFLAFWRAHEVAYSNELYAALRVALPTYAALPSEAVLDSIARKNAVWRHVLTTSDTTSLLARTHALVQQRVGDRFPLMEMVQTSDLYRDHLWSLLHAFYPPATLPQPISAQIEHWVRMDRDVVLRAYGAELERTRTALSERVQLLEHQQRVIDALSTPLLALNATTILMPIVGAIDSHRVEHILETLLQGVVNTQAAVVIFDSTGVPLVDTAVAAALIRISQAVHLLGAQVVLQAFARRWPKQSSHWVPT